MKFKVVTVLIIIMIIGGFLRFYQISDIPSGLNIDEASQGYNAFSLLETGRDRYGQSLPALFRSFGSYQAPLYTYLTMIPVYFLGNSILAVRIVSILSGLLLIIVTFLLFVKEFPRKSILAAIVALMLAIAPWSVFFSRIGTEASLGLVLFASSVLLFYLFLKRPWFFPAAAFILGLSTHAYYSERLLSILFLIGFIFVFNKTIYLKKRIFLLGIVFFIFTQIPHLMVLNSGAFTRRIAQVDYFNEQFFENNSGGLRKTFLGRPLFIVREFSSHYAAYFSPKNLFFDPDPQPERSIPDLSVFYNWMIIPFLFGLIQIFKRRSVPLVKIILLTMVISPIPAALTRDPFYTLRTLVFLWILTIIISFGLESILNKLSKPVVKFSLIILVCLYSMMVLYISYFILLKYERAVFDYSYLKLLEKIEDFPNDKFVVDSPRQLANGIRFAFFKQYNPVALQQELGLQIADKYYSSFEFDEPYILGKIEARDIVWEDDIFNEQVLVGDLLAISDNQVKEHHLKPLFDIKDRAGNVTLKAYRTDPKAKCSSVEREMVRKIEYCRNIYIK